MAYRSTGNAFADFLYGGSEGFSQGLEDARRKEVVDALREERKLKETRKKIDTEELRKAGFSVPAEKEQRDWFQRIGDAISGWFTSDANKPQEAAAAPAAPTGGGTGTTGEVKGAVTLSTPPVRSSTDGGAPQEVPAVDVTASRLPGERSGFGVRDPQTEVGEGTSRSAFGYGGEMPAPSSQAPASDTAASTTQPPPAAPPPARTGPSPAARSVASRAVQASGGKPVSPSPSRQGNYGDAATPPQPTLSEFDRDGMPSQYPPRPGDDARRAQADRGIGPGIGSGPEGTKPAGERTPAVATTEQPLPSTSSQVQRTYLPPEEEARFQAWYKGWAQRAGINPNPDDPQQKYDYRGAYKAGAVPTPDPTDNNRLHWPSQFKDPDHPNRFVGGVDTRTGQPVSQAAPAAAAPVEPGRVPGPGPTRPKVGLIYSGTDGQGNTIETYSNGRRVVTSPKGEVLTDEIPPSARKPQEGEVTGAVPLTLAPFRQGATTTAQPGAVPAKGDVAGSSGGVDPRTGKPIKPLTLQGVVAGGEKPPAGAPSKTPAVMDQPARADYGARLKQANAPLPEGQRPQDLVAAVTPQGQKYPTQGNYQQYLDAVIPRLMAAGDIEGANQRLVMIGKAIQQGTRDGFTRAAAAAQAGDWVSASKVMTDTYNKYIKFGGDRAEFRPSADGKSMQMIRFDEATGQQLDKSPVIVGVDQLLNMGLAATDIGKFAEYLQRKEQLAETKRHHGAMEGIAASRAAAEKANVKLQDEKRYWEIQKLKQEVGEVEARRQGWGLRDISDSERKEWRGTVEPLVDQRKTIPNEDKPAARTFTDGLNRANSDLSPQQAADLAEAFITKRGIGFADGPGGIAIVTIDGQPRAAIPKSTLRQLGVFREQETTEVPSIGGGPGVIAPVERPRPGTGAPQPQRRSDRPAGAPSPAASQRPTSSGGVGDLDAYKRNRDARQGQSPAQGPASTVPRPDWVDQYGYGR